jgi:hypothetical protein
MDDNGPDQFQSVTSPEQENARKTLKDLFEETPLQTEHLLTNLHLYMRSSVLAKVFYVDELYQHILDTPGVVMEFGSWWGANLALFESLRGIYEPYNYSRNIIGFDTFEGYTSQSPNDAKSMEFDEYSLPEGYEDYLRELLDYHEQENVMSHIKKHKVVKGDVRETLGDYLDEHPETIIALAYLDLALYDPTKKVLEEIKPHLTKGSVIAFDELNSSEYPGETIAFKEVWELDEFRLIQSDYLPDRSYLIVD